MSSIREVAELLGIRFRANGSNYQASCPGPAHKNGDRKPSLSFNDVKNAFICFGCGEKGGIIKFTALALGADESIARDWLKDKNIKLPEGTRTMIDFSQYRNDDPFKELNAYISATNEVLTYFYDHCIFDQSLFSGFTEARKYKDDTMSRFGWKIVNRATFEAVGLKFAGTGNGKNMLDKIFGENPARLLGAICIPYYYCGSIATLRFRTTDGNKLSLPGAPSMPYNLDVLGYVDIDAHPNILIVEGETDVLAAATMGFPAIGIPGKTNTISLDMIGNDADSTPINFFVVQDNDTITGPDNVLLDNANKLINIKYGISVASFNLPLQYKDLSESLIGGYDPANIIKACGPFDSNSTVGAI